jgi:hypothetical protein
VSRLSVAPLAIALAGTLLAGATASASLTAGGDRAYARRILLHVSDLPAGWTAGGSSGSRATCTVPKTAGLRVTATLRSPRFQRNENTVIQNRSYVLATQAHAMKLVRRWASLGLGACLRTSLETTGRVTSLASTSMSFDRRGSRTAARRVVAHVDLSNGPSVNIYSDYVFVQKGRAVAGFNFGAVGYKPPLWLERQLTRKVAARM